MSAIAASTSQDSPFVESKPGAKEEKSLGQKNYVSHDEFLTLLITQLTHQDPMEPVNDQEMMGQMAQMQALDEQITATRAITDLRQEMQLQGAGGLIHRYVVGKNAWGDSVEGIVKTAGMDEGSAYVELPDGSRISYTDITEVRDT